MLEPQQKRHMNGGFGADFLLFLNLFFISLFLLLPLALKFPLERREIKGLRAGDVAGVLSSVSWCRRAGTVPGDPPARWGCVRPWGGWESVGTAHPGLPGVSLQGWGCPGSPPSPAKLRGPPHHLPNVGPQAAQTPPQTPLSKPKCQGYLGTSHHVAAGTAAPSQRQMVPLPLPRAQPRDIRNRALGTGD